jgi:hypothetical protein
MESVVTFSLDRLEKSGGRNRRGSKVINRGNLGGIAVVVSVEEFLDEVLCDVAESGLDWLILDFGVGNCNGTLKNTDTLWVLIENGVDVLRLPQRILRE